MFAIFMHSQSEEDILYSKLLKLCDLYGASRFPIPKISTLSENIVTLKEEYSKAQSLISESKDTITSILRDFISNGQFPLKLTMYKLFIKKSKMVFENLNKCLVRDNFYDAEIWCIGSKFDNLRFEIDQLNKGDQELAIQLFKPDMKKDNPPTYFRHNEFLDVFQQIVDTYGIPRYQEINPAVFTAITFPFLFGVMFGDIGHGGALLLVGLYLLWNGKTLMKDPETRDIGRARYLIFFMGFFAFYCGWMYNDFLALTLPVFGGSCYEVTA